MKLTSPAFLNNQFIPSKYTCDGKDMSPALNISGAPANSKSLALIMDDPDAPAGVWVHWTVWNLDPKTTNIAEGGVPRNVVEGVTSFGKIGYGGPCPHRGVHHYKFKLYVLDTVIDLDSSAKKEDLERAISGHVLEQTLLVGLYERK